MATWLRRSSLSAQDAQASCFRHKQKWRHKRSCFVFVPEERLELSPLAGLDFESSAATITPLRHEPTYDTLNYFEAQMLLC